MKAVVLGGGLAGCTMAYLLREKGWEVTLIEQEGYLGGLCQTHEMRGIKNEFGPHILYARNRETRNFFERFIRSREKVYYVKTSIDGRMDNLYDFPVSIDNGLRLKETRQVMHELYQLNLEESNFDNFEDYVISRMGRTLYNYFVKNYNRKQWGLEPREMTSSWVKFRNLSLVYDDKRMFGDKWQGYPKNGYGELFRKLTQGTTVMRGQVVKLEFGSRDLKSVIVKSPARDNDYKSVEGDVFVSTIPIHQLRDDFPHLPYRGVCKIFAVVDKEYVMPTYLTTFPNHYSFTRLMEYKHQSQQKCENSLISAAFPFMGGEENLPMEKWKKEFQTVITEVLRCRVLDTKVVKHDYVYPISTETNEGIFWDMVKAIVRFENLFTVGRLGLYAYVSMDTCIEQCQHLMAMIESPNGNRINRYREMRAQLS